MKKTVKTVHTFIVFALTLVLVVLRSVQLCLYTDSFGLIVKGAESTIAAFYLIASLLFAAVVFGYGRKSRSDVQKKRISLFDEKSRLLCAVSSLAGISMFCDFIFRIIIGYNYISDIPDARMNYFIPLCISAVFSLLCSFYFIAVGISFNSDKYLIRDFKYLHMIPLLWAVSVLCTCLTENVDVVYAEEELLHYIVLILAIVFYVLFITSSEEITGIAPLCMFAAAFGLFAVVLSVPRLIAFFGGTDFKYSDFSSVPYLFTGIFALFVSKTVSGQKKKD